MPPAEAASVPRYSGIAMALHWLVALIVIGLLCVGLWMVGLEISRQKLVVYGWHKWFGLLVLTLVILRLAWRLTHRPPPLPSGLAPWEYRLAPIAHWGLYLLLLAMPISGWLMNSAAGQTVVWFGLLELPTWIDRDPDLLELFRGIHHWLSRGLIALVLLHVAAVVRHDVLRRDGILRRMLPGA
jgi:cytochrome b561